MIAVGDIIDVQVQRVEVFGIFCRHENETILLLIPETSWIASFCSCEQFADPGDWLTVKIKHVDHESRKIAASIRELHPNPWEAGQLQPGDEYKARMVRYVPKADRCNGQPGYLIEVLPGAYAMLRANGITLAPNQQCTVSVIKSDAFMHTVTVSLKHNES